MQNKPEIDEDTIDKILTQLSNSLPRGWPLNSKNPQEQLKTALLSALELSLPNQMLCHDTASKIERFKQRIARLEKKLAEQE